MNRKQDGDSTMLKETQLPKIVFSSTFVINYHIGLAETKEDLQQRIEHLENIYVLMNEYISKIDFRERLGFDRTGIINRVASQVNFYRQNVEWRLSQFEEKSNEPQQGYGSRLD